MIRRVERGYGGCIRRSGQSDPVFYPAAFAEALLIKDQATYSDRAMAVDVDQADAFIGENDENIGLLDKVARCMVVYSPGLAMKLFESEVGSADEMARLNALYSSTPECRNSSAPKGVTSSLQRAAIAYAFYNWKQRSA